MVNLESVKNTIIVGDVRAVLPQFPSNSIDCFIYSPPYNVNIPYDSWNDSLPMDDYWTFTKIYLEELYRIGKYDTRYCINIPYTINNQGKVIFLSADYHKLMLEIGFNFYGHIDLYEDNPHRKKNTAWGSWLSPSAPYFFNSKECILVYYKDQWKKINQGIHDFSEKNKQEFIELAQGNWEYKAQTQKLTEANFSLDIPEKCIKFFTYKEDLICDPFMGSGTTGVACKLLDRNFIGIEISEKYTKVARNRLSSTCALNDFL